MDRHANACLSGSEVSIWNNVLPLLVIGLNSIKMKWIDTCTLLVDTTPPQYGSCFCKCALLNSITSSHRNQCAWHRSYDLNWRDTVLDVVGDVSWVLLPQKGSVATHNTFRYDNQIRALVSQWDQTIRVITTNELNQLKYLRCINCTLCQTHACPCQV